MKLQTIILLAACALTFSAARAQEGLPRKVENPELRRVLRDYFRIRSQKKKVAKSITVYQDAAERFGD